MQAVRLRSVDRRKRKISTHENSQPATKAVHHFGGFDKEPFPPRLQKNAIRLSGACVSFSLGFKASYLGLKEETVG